MNLWQHRTRVHSQPTFLRHTFAVGPLFDSVLFGRKARTYHCVRCKWSFEVCGRSVVSLDENGRPLTGAESLSRFETFAEGPCPALAPLARASVPHVNSASMAPRRSSEPGRLILSH